ncbi:MAG: glucose 1-dehydrogenase [Verrucomicrobia bacterium]|nr:glucose 1-dehydrogenase [Verrucomicrobiota bacterium]
MSLFSLEDRVAIITGAGRGIGRGLAEGLARQGAKVVCAARTRSELDEAVATIKNAGGEALAYEMDMKDLSSVQGGVDAAIERFGQVDILVNNAGINFREPFEEVSEEHYDAIMAVNLKGLYFLTQAVVRDMIPRRKGKIIHIGSLTTGVALAQVSVYTATKGAVGQLAKAHAVELGKHNIQVNAICPGFIQTPLTAKLWVDPTLREWGENRVAMKRLGTPEDLIGTAVFLASKASDYVTGQSIYVDGGFMAGETWPIPQ